MWYNPNTNKFSTPGSIISNALLAINPTIADGAVLTGWSLNSGLLQGAPNILATIQTKIANTVNPARWGSYNNGWVTFIDIYSYIQLYVYYRNTSAQFASTNCSSGSTRLASLISEPLNTHWRQAGRLELWNFSPYSP